EGGCQEVEALAAFELDADQLRAGSVLVRKDVRRVLRQDDRLDRVLEVLQEEREGEYLFERRIVFEAGVVVVDASQDQIRITGDAAAAEVVLERKGGQLA